MQQLEIAEKQVQEEESRHAVKLDVFEGPLELLLHLLKKKTYLLLINLLKKAIKYVLKIT